MDDSPPKGGESTTRATKEPDVSASASGTRVPSAYIGVSSLDTSHTATESEKTVEEPAVLMKASRPGIHTALSDTSNPGASHSTTTTASKKKAHIKGKPLSHAPESARTSGPGEPFSNISTSPKQKKAEQPASLVDAADFAGTSVPGIAQATITMAKKARSQLSMTTADAAESATQKAMAAASGPGADNVNENCWVNRATRVPSAHTLTTDSATVEEVTVYSAQGDNTGVPSARKSSEVTATEAISTGRAQPQVLDVGSMSSDVASCSSEGVPDMGKAIASKPNEACSFTPSGRIPHPLQQAPPPPGVRPASPVLSGGARQSPYTLSDGLSSPMAGSPMAGVSALLRSLDSPSPHGLQLSDTEASNSVQLQVLALSSPSTTSPKGRRKKRRPPAVASPKLAMSLQKTAETLMGMSDQQRQRASTGVKKGAAIFILVSLGAVLVVALVWYLTTVRRPRDTMVNENFCTSLGCVQHADLIGLSESSNAPHEGSPCEHFGRFVCSAWEARHKRRNERRRFTLSVKTDAILDSIVSLENFGTHTVLHISKRPALMMELCLTNRSSDDSQSLEKLLNFMRDSGLGFPDDNVNESDYSRPLRVMAELAEKWAHPLWFRVNIVLPGNSAMERIIFLSYSPIVEVWNDFQDALMVYENVYKFYVRILSSTVYKGSMESPFRKFVTQSHLIQKHIFGNLSRVIANKYHNPVWLKIKNLPSVVKNASAEDWVEALQPLWAIDPPISEEDTVYVDDRDLLDVMDTLFTAYTARDIYLHIHWWFVQSIGAITSNALFNYLLQDPERGPFFRKLICSIHVILNYNTILTSEKRASLTASERATILATISHIHNVAVSKVISVMGAKLALIEKLKPVFWPPDPYADEKQLLRLYGNQTNGNASNIFELWLSRAIGYQQSRAFLDVRSAHAFTFEVDSSSVSSHNVVSRTVSLSLALLDAPYYYPNVTSAIIYGGIGFAYALELVRTLNSISLLLNGSDVIEPTEGVVSHSYIWNIGIPFACRGLGPTDIFPTHVALELAYSTYLKFRRDDEDVRLGNAKRYTPEQIFFATVCYVMCDFASGADECNASMQRFQAFVDAFSCPLQDKLCAILS